MKALFLAPHSANWIQAYPEAIVARALADRGHDVVYVTCGGAFADYCTVMSALGMTPAAPAAEKAAVCTGCTRDAALLRSAFALPGTALSAEVTDEELERADDVVAAAPRDATAASIVVDGVPVGRFSTYQYILALKEPDLRFDDEGWRLYCAHLRNCVVATFAAKRVIARARPDRIIITNTYYGTHAAWRFVAEAAGAVAYSLEAGPNLARRATTLSVSRSTNIAGERALIARWPEVRDVPCTPAELAAVTDHFLELFRGKSVFVYSTQKSAEPLSLRARWSVGARRIVLAATSSPDEIAAGRIADAAHIGAPPFFATQLEWIDELVRWAAARSDVFLVVRVHPREFPNKREARLSDHAKRLQARLLELPANVVVNWPGDEISLYDVLKETDVVLTAWSSAGKEAALFGIPVVSYAPQLAGYPPDLVTHGADRASYFARVDEALAAGWSFERVRRVYRWYVFEGLRATFDLGDAVPPPPAPPANLLVRVARRAAWQVSPRYQHYVDALMRREPACADDVVALLVAGERLRAWLPGFIDDLPRVSEANETRALRHELARLAAALGTDRHPLAERLRAAAA